MLESRLKHFAVTLEIDGLGPGLVKKLVAGGVTTPRLLCEASDVTLSDLVGKKTGVSIADGLKKAMAGITEKRLLICEWNPSSRCWRDPPLIPSLLREPDPRRWGRSLGRIDGWSEEGLTSFLKVYPQYEVWRAEGVPCASVSYSCYRACGYAYVYTLYKCEGCHLLHGIPRCGAREALGGGRL
jgi:hypothetical protein